MKQEARLDYLNDYLLRENKEVEETFKHYSLDTIEEKLALFRGLCNVRSPKPVTGEFIKIQNDFLTEWNSAQPLTTIEDIKAKQQQLYVWQGDITTLAVDGILNAANSELLGCRLANHNCIDNIIHTRAGIQLRLACQKIIEAQGKKEPVGKAKITDAYNLPSDYVIHTVGPYIDQRGVSPFKEQLLASSYRSCLTLADEYHLKTLAFCCVSTGEFNFPNQHAAEIALQTVKKYLNETQSNLQVIFNVFKDEDFHIYKNLLNA